MSKAPKNSRDLNDPIRRFKTEYHKQNPNETVSDENIKQKFNSLPAQDRDYFEILAAKERVKYHEETAKYNDAHQV